jgi:hypothetical protein
MELKFPMSLRLVKLYSTGASKEYEGKVKAKMDKK